MSGVTTTWADPSAALASGGLDAAVDDVLPETYFDRVASNLYRLGGAYGRLRRQTVTTTAASPASYTVADGISSVRATGLTPLIKLPTANNQDGDQIRVIHMGTGTMTISVLGGGSTIFSTSAVASVDLAIGAVQDFEWDGTYWKLV